MSSGAAIGTTGGLAAPAALGAPGAPLGAAGCTALVGLLGGMPVEVPTAAGFTAEFGELAPGLAGLAAAGLGVTFGEAADGWVPSLPSSAE